MAYRWSDEDSGCRPYQSSSLQPHPGKQFIYTPPASPFPEPLQSSFGGYEIHEHGPTLAIPEAPQTFHQELGSQYEYQYSRCTGKRKAIWNLFGLTLGTYNRNKLFGLTSSVERMHQRRAEHLQLHQSTLRILIRRHGDFDRRSA